MPRLSHNDCPYCGCTLDAVTGLKDPNSMPEKNDITVCIRCGGLLQFGENLTLNIMPISALEHVDPDSLNDLLRVSDMIKGKVTSGTSNSTKLHH